MNHIHGSNGNVTTDIVREQEGWLRELVRRLVNESEIDDVVQDTWIEALKTPVHLNGSLRGWLRTVATRLAMRTHRSRRRRLFRESVAARIDESPSVEADVLWTEVRERLGDAVLALPEPYRSTITRRYFEGTSARDIACATHTPVATVRIRLQRGVQRLREDVARRCGPDWRPALAWLALPSREAATLQVTRRLPLLLAAALGSVLAMIGFHATQDTATEPEELTSTAIVAAPVLEPRGPTSSPPLKVVRAKHESLPVRRHTEPVRKVNGRVLDTHGRVIPNAEIWFERLRGTPRQRRDAGAAKTQWHRLGTADQDGRFTCDCPFGIGTLSARGNTSFRIDANGLGDVGQLVSLCLWPIEAASAPIEHARIVASHAVALRGKVVDESGEALPFVRVVARCDQLPDFPEILDHQLFVSPVEVTETDSNGRFTLATYPVACPTQIHLAKPGYRQLSLVPDTSVRSLTVPMTRAEADDPMRIAGRVFDMRGRAVSEAVVGLARARTRTTEGGEYRLELEEIGRNAVLFAGKKGYRTAIERDIVERLRNRRGGTLFVDLTLGPRPRSLAGVLTDGRGIPLPDHLVFLADPVFLDGTSLTAEALAAGQIDSEFGASDVANAAGEFEIAGLNDRSYQIRVYDPTQRTAVDAGAFPAGARKVAIRIRKERFVSLAGRLIDDDGIGVADAKVYFGSEPRKGRGPAPKLRDPVKTGPGGEFVLRRVPREGGTVFVIGGSDGREIDAGVVPTVVKLDRSSMEQRELELVVPRLCHFRVNAFSAPTGSTIQLLDDYGNLLDILVLDATGYRHFDAWPLEGDSTQVLCASQRAKTMVMTSPDGQEISRTPIHLQPEFLTEIDL